MSRHRGRGERGERPLIIEVFLDLLVLCGEMNSPALTICGQIGNQQTLVPSSRGLGHRPLTAETGVRNPLGLPILSKKCEGVTRKVAPLCLI